MTDFKQRVVDEKTDLDGKLDRLIVFSHTSLFESLPFAEQERLNLQRHLMCAYSAVLGARIAAFEP